MFSDDHLEHVLPEHFLVCHSPPFKDNLAEVREEDEPIPGDSVGQVYNFLLHGVEAQHLHGSIKVLQIELKNEIIFVCSFNSVYSATN